MVNYSQPLTWVTALGIPPKSYHILSSFILEKIREHPNFLVFIKNDLAHVFADIEISMISHGCVGLGISMISHVFADVGISMISHVFADVGISIISHVLAMWRFQ